MAGTWKLGPVNLGERPGVAVAIQAAMPPEAFAESCPEAIVELRLDHFGSTEPEVLAGHARAFRNIPSLATLRHPAEGGAWRGDEPDRLACFEALVSEVDAIDIELACGEITGPVVDLARHAGILVIGSFHNFEETPDDARLELIGQQARDAGTDVVKVAARCNAPEDLARLAAFALRHREQGVIAVGMGPYGKASRIFFPALGSLLTYTFLGEPSAPGQLNYVDTLKYLNDFYPMGVATSSIG